MHEGQKGSITLEKPTIYATITKAAYEIRKSNEKD